MKSLVFVAVSSAVLSSFGVDGVWTKQSVQGTALWETTGNWQGSAVPGSSVSDTATLQTTFDKTNDKYNWGTTVRTTLPATQTYPSGILSLASLSGYHHFDLTANGWTGNVYALGDMTDYSGTLSLGQSAKLCLSGLAGGATNAIHRLKVFLIPEIEVTQGTVDLNAMSGVGTLTKTGAGELVLDGVSAAMGVNLKVQAGSVTLKGHPNSLTAPVDGAAFWLDASKAASLTKDAAGDVSAIADARGAGYPVAARIYGMNAKIQSFGDKQMLDLGAYYKKDVYVGDPEIYGSASAFALSELISGVKSFFIVYRYNQPDGGCEVFPFADDKGYTLRPGSDDLSNNVGTSLSYADGTSRPLFQYVQYGQGYQSYAPHQLVTADIRRNGEMVSFNGTPRGFGENVELLSAVMSDDAGSYMGGACPSIGIKMLGRHNDQGYIGGSRIAELVAYTRTLSPEEQRQNIAYLNNKWMKHVGVIDWDLGLLAPNGGTINVPAGRTALVKNLDLRHAPLIKTGEGTLAVRYVKGANKIRVEGGSVSVLPALDPDVTTPELKPAYGKLAHLDATAAGSLVFDANDPTKLVSWMSAESALTYSAGVKSNQGTAVSPTVTEDSDGRKWIDFGSAGWLYFKTGSDDTSKPLGGDTFTECFAVIKKNAGVTHEPAVFGSYSQWNQFCPAGTETMLAASPYAATDNNTYYYNGFASAFWTVNGKWVDPRAERYGDEVQVVRISLGEKRYFNAIGRRSGDKTSYDGGFQIGEVICYERQLTERERVETERYLLKKWAGKEHPDYLASETTTISAIEYADESELTLDVGTDMTVGSVTTPATSLVKTGAGAVTVGTLPAEITSLSVTDGSLSIGAYSRKASAEVKTAMDTLGVVFHVDAADSSTVTLNGSARNNLVRWADVDGRDIAFTPYSGTSGTARPPTLIADYQNGLPAIDMGPVVTSLGDGSLLALPEQKSLKSFYMVYKRYPDTYTTIAGPVGSNSEWKSGGAEAIFALDAGDNYTKHTSLSIDGQAVGNTDGGYPEGMHVFGMRNKNYDWACWGFYRVGGVYTKMGGMYICEILGGTADARSEAKANAGKTIEQYLYDKWIAPKHVSVGSLNVGVTGSLELAGNLSLLDDASLSLAMDANGNVGTITASGDVALTGSGSVSVSMPVDQKPKAGLYPIISGATLAADTSEKLANWTLNVAPAVKSRTFNLKVVDGAICLNVGLSGMTIIVR